MASKLIIKFKSKKKKLFIFEFANNHNGKLKDALSLIRSVESLNKFNNLEYAIKLQYRDLPSFLYKKKVNNKHVDRFRSTKLSKSTLEKICRRIKKNFKLIITPFDEKSVDLAIKHKVDILKIASCSNTDWPLIEKIASTRKPIICSTGGLDLDGIDNIYSFFCHKKIPLTLLHCVSIYPTKNPKSFNLNFINKMKNRYPEALIGYSGHEEEDNFLPVLTSSSLGADVFERHFSIFNNRNQYSIDQKNIKKLLEYLNENINMLGNQIKKITTQELQSLNSLRRGVFVKKYTSVNNIKNNFYYAFPKIKKSQLQPGFDNKNIVYIKNKFKKDEPLIGVAEETKENLIRKYVHRYKGMFAEANIIVSNEKRIELSHHFGLKNLEKTGAMLITVINNNEYCKKLIAMFANQKHPTHRHFKKVETFHLLTGDLKVVMNSKIISMKPGDKLNVYRNEWHSFFSSEGAIFEEISTEALSYDSEYKDKKINKLDTMQRKTLVPIW